VYYKKEKKKDAAGFGGWASSGKRKGSISLKKMFLRLYKP